MDKDKPVIMIIDDQEFFCSLVKKTLNDAYTVKAFTQGQTAIKYLSEHLPDLILLDYEMPNMTGYEVLMSIRADRRTRKIPVLFLTGVENARMETEMLERGANGYIHKPIDAYKLHQDIAKHLKRG